MKSIYFVLPYQHIAVGLFLILSSCQFKVNEKDDVKETVTLETRQLDDKVSSEIDSVSLVKENRERIEDILSNNNQLETMKAWEGIALFVKVGKTNKNSLEYFHYNSIYEDTNLRLCCMNTSNSCVARIVNKVLLLRKPCISRLSVENQTIHTTKA